MKSKYVMISGLAFSEESDMEKLKNYASKGWILEDIIGGFFYKLRKDIPQDIVYSVDYQSDSNEEYFTIFKEAGWEPIVSIGKQLHIFSAKAGTKPIYSDCESAVDKYISAKNRTQKGTLYSLIIAIALIGLLLISSITVKPMFLIILTLLIIDIFVFVFNFMPYLAYKSRINQLGKCKNFKNTLIINKNLWKINGFIGITILTFGLLDLINKKHFSVFFIILGISNIILSLNLYKKSHKNTL